MAGYEDTRQLIIDTLMNRPVGTEIQPENHQEFALAIIDYVRSVELLAGNAFIGFAEANTTPIQSDKGQCFYISTVEPGQTVNFVNFIDSNGNAISVSSPDGKMSLVTLIWNTQYWSSQIVTMDTNWSITQQSGSSESMVMSQKAVTNVISAEETRAKKAEKNLDDKVTDLDSEVAENTREIEGLRDQVENYVPIEITGNVTNAPDEEDLMSEDGFLKLKNRSSLNGMGYVILRRDKTFAEQVTIPNTIYEIRYDFDLLGSKVTIPENCTLNFVGGKIYTSVGTNETCSLKYQNTLLIGDVNLEVAASEGSHIKNTEYCIDWFGLSKKTSVSVNSRWDWSVAFTHLLTYGGTLYFSPNKNYYIHSRSLPSQPTTERENIYCHIKGNGATIFFDAPSTDRGCQIWLTGAKNSKGSCATIKVEGLNWDGGLNNDKNRPTSGTNKVIALKLSEFIDAEICDCKVVDFYGTAFNVEGSSSSLITAFIHNNTLINVGDCYGEGAASGGVGIRLSKGQGIISNNYIHNNFLDGKVSADGNIHRRNWIGINCGENMARNLVIENNDIYGYDRAIHLEIVSPKYQQTIRNNYIAGCDIGIVLWNIMSSVNVENNTIFNTDLDAEHEYIGSSISYDTKKAIYLMGPYDASKTLIQGNFVKCLEGFIGMDFMGDQSMFLYSNASLPDEEGKLRRLFPRNKMIINNRYENQYYNSSSLITAANVVRNNHFDCPLSDVLINYTNSISELSPVFIEGNTIIAARVQLGFSVKCLVNGNHMYPNNYVRNNMFVGCTFGSYILHAIYQGNVFKKVKMSLVIRRQFNLNAEGFPIIAFYDNIFDEINTDNRKTYIMTDRRNVRLLYNADKTIQTSELQLTEGSSFFVSAAFAKEGGVMNAFCFYPSAFTSGGTRWDEEYIGHVKGKFQKSSRVFIGQNKKVYRFTSDGYYALTGWYPNAEYPFNDLINVNGFVYQNVSPTQRGKSGSTKPTFPTRRDATVIDNQLQWTAITGSKLEPSKEWVADTVYEHNDLIYENGWTYEASLPYRKTGATAPTFNQTLNSLTDDNGLIWICRGACIEYEEVVE